MEQENYSIVFSSSTGNTKKLADAVYEILPKDKIGRASCRERV